MSGAQTVALTPELSKAARREAGNLSQNDVIKATGLQAYKLKQWEGRGLSIDLSDLRKLSGFYEAQGVNLSELAEHLRSQSTSARQGYPDKTGAAGASLQPVFTYSPRPGFFISEHLTPEVVDQLMIQMEVNDDRVAELLSVPYETGFLGGATDATEARVRELFGALAQNHLIFRALQGRSVIAPNRNEPEPKTVGDFLSQWVLQSEAAPLLVGEVAGQPSAKAAPGVPVAAQE